MEMCVDQSHVVVRPEHNESIPVWFKIFLIVDITSGIYWNIQYIWDTHIPSVTSDNDIIFKKKSLGNTTLMQE